MVTPYFEKNPRSENQFIGDDPFDITAEEIEKVKEEIKKKREAVLNMFHSGHKLRGEQHESLIEEAKVLGRWDEELQPPAEEVLKTVRNVYDQVKELEGQGKSKHDILEQVYTQFPGAVDLVPVFQIPLDRGFPWGEYLTQRLLARASQENT